MGIFGKIKRLFRGGSHHSQPQVNAGITPPAHLPPEAARLQPQATDIAPPAWPAPQNRARPRIEHMPQAGPILPVRSQAPSFFGDDYVPTMGETNGALKPEGLAKFRSEFSKSMARSNESLRKGDAREARVNLHLRDSGTDTAKAAAMFGKGAFRGLDDLSTSYLHNLIFNVAPDAASNMGNGMSGDGQMRYDKDAYSSMVARDQFKMFFDYLENNKASRQYLWDISQEVKKSDYFGGDFRRAFDFLLSDTFLKYGGMTAGSRRDDFRALQYARYSDDEVATPQAMLMKGGTVVAQKIANSLISGAGPEVQKGQSDSFRNTYGYFDERLNNLVSMMKIR